MGFIDMLLSPFVNAVLPRIVSSLNNNRQTGYILFYRVGKKFDFKSAEAIKANFQLGTKIELSAYVSELYNEIIYRHRPLNAKSYISLPKELMLNKAIINVKNEGDQRFNRCITRPLNPADTDAKRLAKNLKVLAKKLNGNGIEFSVNYAAVYKFERNNDVSLIVYGYNDKMLYVYRRLDYALNKHRVNLLLI